MLYGREWKKMVPLIKTRTVVQIRTHAQKVFKKDFPTFTLKNNHGDSTSDGLKSQDNDDEDDDDNEDQDHEQYQYHHDEQDDDNNEEEDENDGGGGEDDDHDD